MTDRHAGYLVTLEQDVRDDNAEALIAAIKQLRGVLKVDPIVSDVHVGIAQARAEFEIRERVLAALWPDRSAES
jgi:hypothetical protein